MTYLSSTEQAKEIRKQLKSAFPGTKFSVRTSRGSVDSAIYIEWTDGPTVKEVEATTNKHERIDRCDKTHEILSGGNSFVFCHRNHSAETYQQAVKDALALNCAMWSHLSFESLEFTEKGNQLKGNIYTIDRGMTFWFTELVYDQLNNKSFVSATPKNQELNALLVVA